MENLKKFVLDSLGNKELFNIFEKQQANWKEVEESEEKRISQLLTTNHFEPPKTRLAFLLP